MAKCPVCEMRTEDDNERLCPSCGWEFRYILGNMSREEEAIYNRKLEICRRNWQGFQALKKWQKQQTRADAPDQADTAEKEEPVAESGPENTLYSEETPVPDFGRDPFEYSEEFEARIGGHKPVLTGKATLIKEKYDIETGRFPMDVSWEDWTRNVEGIPESDSDLHVIAERDLARAIYEAGPAYSLFAKFKAEKEKVSVNVTELFTGNKALSVITGNEALPVAVPGAEAGGDMWTDPVTGMEFIKVPGGTFMMGDILGDNEYDDEKSVHEVQLSGFYIGKYLVTQGQWKKVTGNNPAKFQKGDDYPVECVSWHDVQEFIKKLTEMNRGKHQFRLSREAEWEYAARSGGKKERYAGGDDIDDVAWYKENSGSSTHPVGKKAPNGLGIHDMSGNVWEWCEDWLGNYPSGSVKNPEGPDLGSHRVIRGGGWNYAAGRCRSAYRGRNSPGHRNGDLGLRLALFPGQQ